MPGRPMVTHRFERRPGGSPPRVNWSELFDEGALSSLDIRPVLLNLAIVLVLGQILAWHYQRCSEVLSDRRKLARVIVFISATTMLVISVVKTSLALSLGLVGALSIIRFRTPVKEPEELAYLFLAVALGIGLGADQRLATTILFTGILIYLTLSKLRRRSAAGGRMLVHVSVGLHEESQSPESLLERLLDCARGESTRVDLRRVDSGAELLDVTLAIDLKQADLIGRLLAGFREIVPGGTVSVVEGASLD